MKDTATQRWKAQQASPPAIPPSSVAHTLVLEFGRPLTLQEWAAVMHAVRRLPYVQRWKAVDVPLTPLRPRRLGPL